MDGGIPDVVGAGPVGEHRPGWAGRRSWMVPGGAAIAGLLLGVLGTHLVGGATGSSHPGLHVSGSAPLNGQGAGIPTGVVLPEVVDAQTLPGSNDQEVVAEAVPGASTPGPLRYDYSLVGAPWLAPDGTVRSGPPGCLRASDEVQYLQVAVVHARAVAGGPDVDRVVWYRCGTPPPGVVLPAASPG